MEYVYLPLGFLILIVGGNLLIKGGVEMASHLKVSKLVIGIIIVSFGTSAPEIFISISAALRDSSDIVTSNIVGSNIANIALILGTTAIILPVPVQRDTMLKDWPVLLFISVLLLVFFSYSKIVLWEGVILIALLIGYIFWLIRNSRKKSKKTFADFTYSHMNIFKVIIIIILAVICLYAGSEILIHSAKEIARNFNISERVIGLSLIAFGTSIPELITSVLAAMKKQMEISVGNIIGSNIYNICAALGITSLIKPIDINLRISNFDIFYMLGLTVLLFLLLLPIKRSILTRWKGIILLGSYIFYIYLIFF